MAIKLKKKDIDELVELTNKARNTPVVAMSMADGLNGKDFASQAWEKVRQRWVELGKKYGFDPREVKGIKSDTGEVLL